MKYFAWGWTEIAVPLVDFMKLLSHMLKEKDKIHLCMIFPFF